MIGKLSVLIVVIGAAMSLASPIKFDPLEGLTFDGTLSEAERCKNYAAKAEELAKGRFTVQQNEQKYNGLLYSFGHVLSLVRHAEGEQLPAEQEALLKDIKRCMGSDGEPELDEDDLSTLGKLVGAQQ